MVSQGRIFCSRAPSMRTRRALASSSLPLPPHCTSSPAILNTALMLTNGSTTVPISFMPTGTACGHKGCLSLRASQMSLVCTARSRNICCSLGSTLASGQSAPTQAPLEACASALLAFAIRDAHSMRLGTGSAFFLSCHKPCHICMQHVVCIAFGRVISSHVPCSKQFQIFDIGVGINLCLQKK
jgi:hypothetical protein